MQPRPALHSKQANNLPDRRATKPPRVSRSNGVRKATCMTKRHKMPFSHLFSGLPLLGSLDGSPLIFQQHHFLAGCATVDMKMQTPIISMEMQFPDIISWRRLWERTSPDLSVPGEIFIIRAVTPFHAPSERRPSFLRTAGIKTRLEGAKSKWVEELPSVLWAYRTTVRIPTKETPFKLTFGTEAIILVEIGLTTLRTTFHKEEENEGQLHLNLDLLDETREKAAQRIALYQGKMARYYNTKVKLRRFEVGDWVLRKVTQATKDPSQGKLGPNWEGPYKIIQYYRRGTYHLEDRHGKKLPHPWNAEHLKKYYP
uniref:Reverse transcriptase domain-containing protein n=1 Tax=Fagus sylvatica TaxID=28930 RepID=A0A2N9H429_FAGSY